MIIGKSIFLKKSSKADFDLKFTLSDRNVPPADLTEQGCTEQDSRGVASFTKIRTCDLRNWYDFLKRFSAISKSHLKRRDLTLYCADLFLSVSLLFSIVFYSPRQLKLTSRSRFLIWRSINKNFAGNLLLANRCSIFSKKLWQTLEIWRHVFLNHLNEERFKRFFWVSRTFVMSLSLTEGVNKE